MKRRDTIVIAVLVNISLLIVLFVTATKPSHRKKLVESLSTSLGSQEGLHTPQVFDLDPKIPLTHNNILQQFAEAMPVVLPEESPSNNASIKEEKQLVQHISPQPNLIELNQNKSNPSQILLENNRDKEEFVSIIVKKGDFLEKIAKANNTTVATLIKINQLTTTQLKIGQVLKVPTSHCENKSDTASLSEKEEFYVVKEGDSPWTIALRHKMKLEELLQLNDLDEYKARRIKPGDQLRIR